MCNHMETIQLIYPEIRLEGSYYREQAVTIERFCAAYNQGRPSCEQLKGEHMGVLETLLGYAQIVIAQDTASFYRDGLETPYKPGDWIRVNLSKTILANQLKRKKCTETIKRYKRRLIQAGAIIADREQFEELGLNKAHYNDVLINPDLVLVYRITSYNVCYTKLLR